MEKIVFGGYSMKGYKRYNELKEQYIYSKTFDKSDVLIGNYIHFDLRNIYGFDKNKIICNSCICEYMCHKLTYT